MSVFTALILGAIVIAAAYAVVIYNGLVQLKHNVAKAWANIDILLKQRHDELPKLVGNAASIRSSNKAPWPR